MVKADTIEVEIDNAKNFDLFFQPLARPLRGRLVMSRIPEPSAAGLARRPGSCPAWSFRLPSSLLRSDG